MVLAADQEHGDAGEVAAVGGEALFNEVGAAAPAGDVGHGVQIADQVDDDLVLDGVVIAPGVEGFGSF